MSRVLGVKRRRDQRRQRAQFAAVAGTIGLGALLFTSTYAAYLNLAESYNRTYDRLNFADVTVVGAQKGFAGEVRSIDGVDQVEERSQADVPFKIGGADPFLGRIIGYPADGQPAINQIDVVDGEYLDPADPSKVVVAEFTATEFHLEVGNRFEMLIGEQEREVTVGGIAVTPEYIWPARSRQDIFPLPGTFGVAFVSAEVLGGAPGVLVDRETLITYDEGVDVGAMDAEIRDAAVGAGATEVTPQADQASNATLQLDVQGFQQLAIMFPALFMTVAGLAAFVLLSRLIVTQRSIIGTMRASGLSRGAILRHYLSYGTRLGVVASVVGVVLGTFVGAAITGVYTDALDIPDTVRSLHVGPLIAGVVFGLAAGALGAYAPARLAFKTSPAEAMRGDVPRGGGHPSLLERVVPPVRRLPVRWRLALRGPGRNKRRSLSTILGVVLALTLIMVSWGMIESTGSAIDRQFNEVAREDADVYLSVPATGRNVGDVAGVAGVAHVETISTLDAAVSFGSESYGTTIEAYPTTSEVHDFPGGLPADGVLAGKALADELGVRVGDTLHIQLTTLDTSFSTELKGFLDEPLGTFVYIRSAALASKLTDPSLMQQPGVASLKVLFSDGANAETTIDRIGELQTVTVAVDAKQLVDTVEGFLGFFYVFVGIMLLFGGAMAFALMFNTMSVNVSERASEFATMRANGLSYAGLARVTVAENLLVTGAGILPGVVVGWVLGVVFMASFSSDMFTLTYTMSVTSVLVAVLAMMLTAGLSLAPALRTIRKLDVGKVVRERAA